MPDTDSADNVRREYAEMLRKKCGLIASLAKKGCQRERCQNEASTDRADRD